jgi:ABC-type phosphate/phosphonate transport system substrate-binding protein
MESRLLLAAVLAATLGCIAIPSVAQQKTALASPDAVEAALFKRNEEQRRTWFTPETGQITDPVARAFIEGEELDPFVRRQAILQRFKRHIDIYFYPSAKGNNETYHLLRNFLPVMNHLSMKMGAVVNFVPMKNVSLFKTHAKNKVPDLLFVHAPITETAIPAGYQVVLYSEETLTTTFLVLTDSPMKTIADLKGKSIGWASSSQNANQARYELLEAGIAQDVKTFDVGNAGQQALASSLSSRNVDALVVRHTLADSMIKTNPSFRKLHEKFHGPGFAFLIRPSTFSERDVNALVEAMLEVGPTKPRYQDVYEGMKNGTGILSGWKRASNKDFEQYLKAAKIVDERWPAFTARGAEDAAKPGTPGKPTASPGVQKPTATNADAGALSPSDTKTNPAIAAPQPTNAAQSAERVRVIESGLAAPQIPASMSGRI